MSFGRSGAALCKEIVDHLDDPGLPQFNAELVRRVHAEAKEHAEHIEALKDEVRKLGGEWKEARAVDAEGTDALHAAVVVHHESVLRNKRCLMAYQHARTQRLMALRHALGPVLPTDVTEALSRAEREFVGGHSKLLRQYAKATGVDLATHRTPPAEAFIEVRCLRDGGDIYTEDGAVTLAKNSIHRLRRSEAEALIAQGVLEQVKSF